MTKLDNLTVFIPVANGLPGTLLHLQRALTALVQGASHVQLLVSCNGVYNYAVEELLVDWQPLFVRNQIDCRFRNFPQSSALAHMAMDAFDRADRPWFMNHDVDLLVTPEAWMRIETCLFVEAPSPCLFYNFVDVRDRGFPGWTAEPTPWTELQAVRRQHGDHGLVYREWAVNPAFTCHAEPVTDVWAGSYVLATQMVCTNAELRAELATFTPGQRGYDRVITRRWCRPDHPAHVVCGATARHFGVDALMGRNFRSYHPLVQADVQRFTRGAA